MNSKTSSAVATLAPSTPTVMQETIRPVSTVEGLLQISGERVTVPKDAKLTASELAAFIADRDTKARTFGAQARWTFYSVGQLPSGDAIQGEIRKRLEHMLSKSALYQLTSEATTLIPLIVAEGLNVPVSLLKDAKGDLLVNESTGHLLPLKKQPAAGRELIPLLKSGKVTQAAIRDIRAKHKNGTATTGKATAPKSESKAGGTFAELAEGAALDRLSNVSKYLDSNRPTGDKLAQFVALTTDIARKLGYAMTQAGAAPLATATVAKGK